LGILIDTFIIALLRMVLAAGSRNSGFLVWLVGSLLFRDKISHGEENIDEETGAQTGGEG